MHRFKTMTIGGATVLAALCARAAPDGAATATVVVTNAKPDVTLLLLGAPAPALALDDIDGKHHDAKALHGEKNLVLVFFRGTW